MLGYISLRTLILRNKKNITITAWKSSNYVKNNSESTTFWSQVIFLVLVLFSRLLHFEIPESEM